MLAHLHASHRRVAVFLSASFKSAVTLKRLIPLLADQDWRVVGEVVDAFQKPASEPVRAVGLFDALDPLLAGMPKSLSETKPLVWPWEKCVLNPDRVLRALLTNCAVLPWTRLHAA